MTANKRIVLNILATYGRSLFALVCGLFTGRWVLQSLGHVDYGIYGVVGGLTAFIAFFNNILSSAVGRFYAVAIGQASVSEDKNKGLVECQRWFSCAVALHFVVPMILIVVGYPVGVWAVTHWLVIPSERIPDAVWIFRFVCLSCFAGMVNVPFQALYTARQYIAELTIYGVIQTCLNLGFLYYMVTHPGDWLVRYAGWVCFVSVLPQVIICLRAFKVFPECRFVPSYCIDMQRFRQLLSFAGWQMFGLFGALMRGQGISLVVNKYFGPKVNSAMAIATNVSSQTNTLSSAMVGAFSPVIMTEYGAGHYDEMRNMALQASKFAVALTLLFALPLFLEIDSVIRLWLVEPPKYTIGLCAMMLIMLVVDNSTVGHYISVRASGKIAMYNVFIGGVFILTMPMAWCVAALGGGPYSIGCVLVVASVVGSIGRVVFSSRLTGMSARIWMRKCVCPLSVIAGIVVLIGSVPRYLMQEGVMRIFVTGIVCEIVYLPCFWTVLSETERSYIRTRFNGLVERVRGW